jgi:hypothetical protein
MASAVSATAALAADAAEAASFLAFSAASEPVLAEGLGGNIGFVLSSGVVRESGQAGG